MQATFLGVEFVRILFRFKKRKELIRRRMSSSSIKRQIRRFHVVVGQWTSKNVLKSVMHVQSCCFDHEPIASSFEVVVVVA